MPKRKTKEEFIADAVKVHGNKYDYSEVVYVNNKTNVCIICPEHGRFFMRPDCHIILKQGCPKCGYTNLGLSRRLSKEDFIKKAKEIHGDKYDYTQVNYVSTEKKVDILCPIHGLFRQTPHNHIGQKQGCPKCSKRYMDTDYFIVLSKKVHGDKYDYSKVEYVNSHKPVTLICPVHGEFKIRPNDHLSGHGCAKCYNSKLENEVETFLEEKSIDYIKEKTYEDLKCKNKLRYDFYLPKENVLIECQGEQHYQPVKRSSSESKTRTLSNFKSLKKRDKLKYEYAKEHNIKLIYYTHVVTGGTDTIVTLEGLYKEILDV